MFATLRTLIVWAIGSFSVKLFASLGIGVASYAVISEVVNQALTYMQTVYGQLPSDVISILFLASVPQGLSIMGSALLTAALIQASKAVFAKR